MVSWLNVSAAVAAFLLPIPIPKINLQICIPSSNSKISIQIQTPNPLSKFNLQFQSPNSDTDLSAPRSKGSIEEETYARRGTPCLPVRKQFLCTLSMFVGYNHCCIPAHIVPSRSHFFRIFFFSLALAPILFLNRFTDILFHSRIIGACILTLDSIVAMRSCENNNNDGNNNNDNCTGVAPGYRARLSATKTSTKADPNRDSNPNFGPSLVCHETSYRCNLSYFFVSLLLWMFCTFVFLVGAHAADVVLGAPRVSRRRGQ